MPGGGTRTFLECDHYEAGLRDAQIQAVIVSRGTFKARLTWADLHNVQVLRCEEDAPRVAYMCLAPRLAFVMFPAYRGPLPVWQGVELQAGEITFHGRGEGLHQSTQAFSVWNVIAIDLAQLDHYGGVMSCSEPVRPDASGSHADD